MKLYSLVVEERLIKEVDKLIKEHGLYSSRSDFIRDAIRSRLLSIRGLLGEAAEEEKEGEIEESRIAAEVYEELKQRDEERKYAGVH